MCILCLPTALLPGRGACLYQKRRAFKETSLKSSANLFERFFGTVCCIFKNALLLKLEVVYRVKAAVYMLNTVKLGTNKALMNNIDTVQS